MKSDRIKNWPKAERPRERLLAEGADKLTQAELLAIILRVGQGTFTEGVREQNASDFARTLLSEYGGLAGLDRAHVQDLLKVPGLGPAKVAQIKAAFRLGKLVCSGKSGAVSFESSQAVADYFRPRFTGKRQEIVVAVFLNGQNKPLDEKEITEGTPTQATVYDRRVIEEALHLSAAAVVLVHNHPLCGAPHKGCYAEFAIMRRNLRQGPLFQGVSDAGVRIIIGCREKRALYRWL